LKTLTRLISTKSQTINPYPAAIVAGLVAGFFLFLAAAALKQKQLSPSTPLWFRTKRVWAPGGFILRDETGMLSAKCDDHVSGCVGHIRDASRQLLRFRQIVCLQRPIGIVSDAPKTVIKALIVGTQRSLETFKILRLKH
jgi:hypothetical protein